ncbi:MAG: hypothetical protein HC800_15640 [Phormidesmis sp. RL_2_1]|nr:hypothetical protein [Phormidesmis sp. RL_2_1]
MKQKFSASDLEPQPWLNGLLSISLLSGLFFSAPVVQAPVVQAPVVQPPVVQAPVVQAQSAQSNEFRRIQQPLGLKVGVTAAGIGLIGLELWWFLYSKPKVTSAAHPPKGDKFCLLQHDLYSTTYTARPIQHDLTEYSCI